MQSLFRYQLCVTAGVRCPAIDGLCCPWFDGSVDQDAGWKGESWQLSLDNQLDHMIIDDPATVLRARFTPLRWSDVFLWHRNNFDGGRAQIHWSRGGIHWCSIFTSWARASIPTSTEKVYYRPGYGQSIPSQIMLVINIYSKPITYERRHAEAILTDDFFMPHPLETRYGDLA